jgi:hypothetical protein
VRGAVDDDAPGVNLLCDGRGALGVGGGHISLQPIGRVIGDCDRIRLVVVGQQAQYRPDNLCGLWWKTRNATSQRSGQQLRPLKVRDSPIPVRNRRE